MIHRTVTTAILALALHASQSSAVLLAGEVLESFTEPYKQSDVAADEIGVIHTISVRPGERVKKDQVLATLDLRALEARLEVAKLRAASEARVVAAQAKLEQATTRNETLKQMDQKGHTTPMELESANTDLVDCRSELQLAQEARIQLQAEVKQIQAEIEHRIIRSPFDGIITRVHLEQGEQASSSAPVVVSVVQLDQLRVKFFIGTALVRTLRRGASVPLSIDGKRHQGVVEFVSPVTDSDSNTARIDVVLANEQQQIRSGEPCRLLTDTNSTTTDDSVRVSRMEIR